MGADFNWAELKSKCISQAAREIARSRLPATHNSDPTETRLDRWARLAKEADPEAIEKIKAMNGLELIDLLSEVMTYG